MSGTLAQVQAETLHDDVKRIVVADQFAQDWLLVAMNDYDSYTSLLLDIEGKSVSEFSDEIRRDWENLAEQVCELVEENISPIAGLFISQILKGQGSLPFDIIAKEVSGKYLETKTA
jgi:hypothetical protein